MKVEEQLRLEFCSPLFCEPASTSHRHLVYKTPRRGLTSQKGPGGRRTGWVTWCSASSRGPGEMSLCHYVTVSLCQCQPCRHSCPHGARTGTLAHRQHPQAAPCPPPHPVCVNPLGFPSTFWRGGCAGTQRVPVPNRLSGHRCHGKQPQLGGSCVWAWKNIQSLKGKTEL